jgi:hypothetical protein
MDEGSILPQEKIIEALDTPVIVEAAVFHNGIVIVQVNQIADKLPRVDIPASWVDVVVEPDRPFAVELLFTREPRVATTSTVVGIVTDMSGFLRSSWGTANTIWGTPGRRIRVVQRAARSILRPRTLLTQ